MSARFGRLLLPGSMTLAMLAVLIGLGSWQVSRLMWKTQVLSEIARAETEPAQPLGAKPSAFAKVLVSGRLRPAPTALYGADVRPTAAGPEMGARQIAVLDRLGAPPLLVDRGWVSTRRVPAPPDEPVTIEGFVHPGDTPSWFAATDDRANRRFHTLNPAAIAESLGVPNAPGFVLVALGTAGSPDPARHLPRPPNNHLIYAATWYGFAVTLAIIFILWARKGRSQ